MGLTRIAIVRPLAMLMLILGLVLMGGFAFTRLRVDRLPPLSFPFVSISVDLPGASPEDVEGLLLEPLEDAVAGLSGASVISSSAREGGGSVSIQYVEGTDTDRAVIDVERRLAGVRGSFPRDAGAPRVNKFDPNSSPIMNIALTGGALTELFDLAQDVIQPQLLSVPGVADVSVSGGLRREVRVRLDPTRLEAYGIAVEQVTAALQRENVNSPGGSVDRERSTVNVRSIGEFRSIEELQSMIVASKPTGTVYLRNLATVEETTKRRTRIQRFNGADAVGLSVIKQSDANTLEVADKVRATLDKLRSALPDDAQLVVTNDSSRFVRRSVEAVQRDLILAVFLTATVLLLFLHSWRNTLIVVLAIPTSLVSTFLVMYAVGFSVNLMTLMALAMTIGILVDDSIVVLENIHRHLTLGEGPFEAALKGRSEIGLAAMAITFTDIVVYLPVAFMAGNIGQLFIQYGLTIAVATLFSLFISFTLTPMLASRWSRPGDADEEHPSGSGPLALVFRAWERGFDAIRHGYGLALRWSLLHRLAIVAAGVFAIAVSVGISPVSPLKILSSEYAPQEDDGQFNVNVQMPPTATLVATDEAVQQMEAMLAGIPEIRGVFANASRNSGNIAVELVEKGQRSRSVQDIMVEVRQLGRSIPEASVRATASAALGGGGGFIAIVIMGDDLDTLNAIGAQVQEVAKATPGIADANSSAQARQDETRFVVHRERAANLGVTASQVGSTLRTLVQGSTVSRLERPGELALDITVVGPEVRDPRSLTGIPVASGRAGLVRIGQVTTLRPSSSPVQISRTDRKRAITVTSTTAGRALGDVARDLRQNLDGIPLPPGYRIDVRGSAQQLNQALAQLTTALGMSVLLIYMLLVALYESWLIPLAIMFSLPVALVGAFGGLILTGNTINIFSMMGMIALMGLVAKNAILLVDYTNSLRSRGVERFAAILEAGRTRLRPIMMTTMTVIAAMIPLALKLEVGSESRAPMAVVVIGGSISSTLLTLLLVPVMYTILDDVGTWLSQHVPSILRWWRRRTPAAPQPSAVLSGVVVTASPAVSEMPALVSASSPPAAIAGGALPMESREPHEERP